MSIRIGFAILFGLALLLGVSTPAAAQSDSEQQQTSEQLSEGDNMSAKDQNLDESKKEPGQEQSQSESKDEGQDKSQSQGESQSQTTQAEQASFISRQESSQVLASSIIGMTIQNSTDKEAEQIGSVNDLIMNEQNQLVGVVVGVGGFLGIGEKNVGIPMAAVTDIDAKKDIAVVTVSKKQLQNAPAFTTKKEQKQEQKQKQMQQKMEQKKQEMKKQQQEKSPSTLDSEATASGG